jgi:o-succinylbenzoate synthase
VTLRLSQRATQRVLPRVAENARTRWLARDAQIITLMVDSDLCGSGEASPLPGFSPDTLAACQHALSALDLRAIPERLEPDQPLLLELARASARLPVGVPAARAALEAALLDLWSRAAGVPAWALLWAEEEPPQPRQVAALLQGEPEHALEQALSARARGIGAFKLKIGRPAAAERELAALSELRAALGPDVSLRLDANRAWSGAEARAHLPLFARAAPELVEEPCARADLSSLAPSAVRLALDESLIELSPDQASVAQLSAWGVRALILKPTLLGGISACAAWAAVARQCGADVILSHTFEGPLGLGLAATLALTIGSEHVAHGLDLEGARLDLERSSCFVGAQICAWSEPGLAAWQVAT